MRVQAIRNYGYYNYNVKGRLNNSRNEKPQSFGSLFADANQENQMKYGCYMFINPDFAEIKGSSTRIFRELSSELAISKLLDPNQKTEIKILGSADGSEAWAHAIAVKESMGNKAKNVSIVGIDRTPYMTALANTGSIVMSSVERDYANGYILVSRDSSPLKGKGWRSYLRKSQRPEQFKEILRQYPCTRYIEYDPIVHKSIGNGLEWYEVNKEGLPNVRFECADMRESLTPDEDTDNQVYVLANSAAYVYQDNPKDFIKLFEDIKRLNKDKKHVYVVVGNLENHLFYKTPQGVFLTSIIDMLGFRHVPENNLKGLGIKGYKEASLKIFELKIYS